MKAAVIMGSKSDLPVLKPAIDTLRDFGIEVEAHIMSAHRTPELAADFAKNAKDNGVEVIIAAAGKAAHLAGVIAVAHDSARHWPANQIIYYGWYGFPAFHRPNAGRDPGRYGSDQRRQKCRAFSSADSRIEV